MVRYLEKSEYGKCRPLWEEAFPEDSKSFADYYFSEKLPGSKVLAIEGGKLLTMAHLNPYTISVNGKKWELPYIVGVATAAHQRHKGYMRQVLNAPGLKSGEKAVLLPDACCRGYLPAISVCFYL